MLATATVAMLAACGGARTTTSSRQTGTSAGLSAADVEVVAALLEIADARRPDTAVIDRALASSLPYVRAFGARVIGQNLIASRAAAARRLVADTDTAVAADAAFSLGLLHDSSSVAMLREALARSRSVADAAAWSLGELGASGRATIEAVLARGQPRGALASVLQAAAKLRPVPSALITPHLADADPGIRRAAAYAVTRSRVPASTRALVVLESRRSASVSASSETETDLWSYVARGLGQPVAGDSLGGDAQAALRRLVDYPHPHVRINAMRSLATYGPAARATLVAQLRDRDANARVALAQSLGDVLGADDAAWRDVWAADTGFTYRRSTLSAAVRAGVRLPALDPADPAAWHRRADWRYRAAAAQAAGAGTIALADAIAGPLVRDDDARVRNAAWAALVAWTDSSAATGKPYARSALGAALGDRDLFVRATILDAIRDRARAADASLALRALRDAAADPESDARVAALRVIAAAWTRDSLSFPRALLDSLRAVAPPSDPLERAVGRSSVVFAHWPSEAGTPRAPAWYADQVRSFVLPDVAGNPARVAINTARGTVRLRLFAADAPLTVANFVSLARRGYYNRLVFHRVVPNFVAQDGDPRGDGSGGPGYAIRDELNRRWYDRGAVGMALSGPDTGGSQYFIAHSPQPHLDGHYTVFGHVIDGFDVLDAIVQGDAIVSIVVQ